MPQPMHQASPQLFFDTVNAYQRTASLKGAIELDLFSLIGEGKNTSRDLATACGAAERGVRILCDYLVVIGFLTKEGLSYRLTPDSAVFLDQNSPAYLGAAVEFLLSPMLTSAFQDVAASVRKGGTVLPEGGTVNTSACFRTRDSRDPRCIPCRPRYNRPYSLINDTPRVC